MRSLALYLLHRLLGNRRKAGAYLAGRTRRLNRKYGAGKVASDAAPLALSVAASVAQPKDPPGSLAAILREKMDEAEREVAKS